MTDKMDIFEKNTIFFTNRNFHHILFQCRAFYAQDIKKSGNIFLLYDFLMYTAKNFGH